MASLISLRPGVDWTASGGLFDWVLEQLMSSVSDPQAASWLREIVDNNLGSLWVHELEPQTQREIVTRLRADLVAAAERELPDGEGKAAALAQLRELADLTYRTDVAV